jgi:tetratricopeptide (TPR) repeat protein
MESFQRALASDPSFADAHFNLAMTLQELKREDEARAHWEAYLKLDPESKWAEIARRHLRTRA